MNEFSDPQQQHGSPPLGLVDVIEAFTAMRHEWRGQTRETRQLSEALQQTVGMLSALEERLIVAASGSSASEEGVERTSGEEPPLYRTAREMAEAIAEIDRSLTRAIHAATRRNRSGDLEQLLGLIGQAFEQQGTVSRWRARPFFDSVREALDRWAAEQVEDPTVEGLKLLGARVQRLMRDRQIERIDLTGEPFDGETMKAVDAITRSDVPSGHVAEQLSPAYRWQGRLIHYAEVRVAR